MPEISVSVMAAFSRDGRVFRAFGHLLAVGTGSMLCVPLALAAGSLRHVTDGCPVPWEEVFLVLDAPPRDPVSLPWHAVAREFPLLAQVAQDEAWRMDWVGGCGCQDAQPRLVLRLTHESGIRFAAARGRA